MKLVQILARELKEWPVSADAATQDNSSVVHFSSGPLPVYGAYHAGEWSFLASGANSSGSPIHVPFASDYSTAIVTRADWEAERARIAEKAAELHMQQEREKLVKPKRAKKDSADGWIRHRGGKCPVDNNVKIEYRERCGNISIEESPQLLETMWIHDGSPFDIMAYRIHKPAEQPEPVTLPEGYGEIITATLESTSGPLQWRDRIHEIDAEVTKRNEAHRQAIEAFEEERASFVQRLEDEGLQLFQGKVCGGVQPVEDMSDWRNWKEGDLIECCNDYTSHFTRGKNYAYSGLDEYGACGVIADDEGDANGWSFSNFKWHSRPSA